MNTLMSVSIITLALPAIVTTAINNIILISISIVTLSQYSSIDPSPTSPITPFVLAIPITSTRPSASTCSESVISIDVSLSFLGVVLV